MGRTCHLCPEHVSVTYVLSPNHGGIARDSGRDLRRGLLAILLLRDFFYGWNCGSEESVRSFVSVVSGVAPVPSALISQRL